MIDIKSGKIETQEGLITEPNYRFDEFKTTRFYNGQDGVKIIYLEEKQTIDNMKFIVSLFFKNQKIYMLSLICCDSEFSDSDEPKRKLLHDKILSDIGINQREEYKWGKISSDYDARSNISSINIVYI
jgi:hypothetical protein